MNEVDLKAELAREYAARFAGAADYRRAVWRVLTADFFQPIIGPNAVVLDLGCGWGEFINQIQAARKIGMDLNPETRGRLEAGVEFLEQDCAKPWALRDGELDVVFTSNFLEHLRTKDDLRATLAEAQRCLKPGGRIICLGPNIKYLPGHYWDFWDHYLALTELAMTEVLRLQGYTIERCVGRFLPYRMSGQRTWPMWVVRFFLRVPWLWWTVGRQFLVIARAAR